MKQIGMMILAALLLTACGNKETQLQDYVKQHKLNIHYYQDEGWPAVALED